MCGRWWICLLWVVAVHSFRLWKLKVFEMWASDASKAVAVHSFRLWKLKAATFGDGLNAMFRCSSLVPIVETESQDDAAMDGGDGSCSSLVPIVETESYAPPPTLHSTPELQFTRSDCGN